MSDDTFQRGVDADEVAEEIRALREAAERCVDASRTPHVDIARLGLELEHAAVCYAEKRAARIRAASRIDYLAIVEAAERDRNTPKN